LTTEEAEATITLYNSGTSEITGLEYEKSGQLDALTISLPAAIPASGQAQATLSISPFGAASYVGVVTVKSGSLSVPIGVSVSFEQDITLDISSAQGELDSMLSTMTVEQKDAFDSLISDIDASLVSAQSDIASGDYASASRSYTEASAKLDALRLAARAEPAAPTGPIDTGAPAFDLMNTAILALAAMIILLAAYVLFRKLRKRRNKAQEKFEEKQEEELDVPEDEEEEF